MSTRTLLTALLATALSIPALAQPATTPAAPATPAAASPAAAAPAAPAVSVEGAAPVAAPVTRDKDTLSVDFPDEDIKTILRNVADLFELNLVVPDTLTGKTSIKLRDVTWRQIFQVVLSPAGYTYIEEGNIIKIVSNELLQQEPGSTEVFVLNNAKAADIKPTIDGLVDAAGGGKIVIDARSNALVITEKPSRMKRIHDIIEKLDVATDQVMIESKFVEVTDRDIRNIGVNWASLQGMTLGVGGMNQTFTRSRGQDFSGGTNSNSGTGSTTTNGTTTTTNNTSSTTNNVTGATTTSSTAITSPSTSSTTTTSNGDLLTFNSVTGLPTVTVVPPVSNTTTTTSTGSTVTTSSSSPASSQVNTSSTTGLGTVLSNALNTTANTALNSLASLTNTGGTARVASAVFSASDFSVIISALKTQNNTKIVSNPTVVTLNNTEAILNIGQEFPIPKYNYNAERGTFEVAGFEYKPIGVILKVTPQVNGRGVIKLVLEPEVSQQNGSTSFGGAGGAQIPIIATRKVKTQISLQSGSTAGIGGLITSSINHGGTKVPILGDIPLLGRLFSSKAVQDEVTNLLIFITAKTITADGAVAEEVFDPRAVEAVGMSREDLPGNRTPKGTDMFAPKPPTKK
ncbi:MAG: secretin N-terminal domain-containing protein [bacterium]|nr:secretin N-terminal domain-containing protein [bacterium]MDI1335504.1 secretin N-terminal domain-containing protein [Lacunisphaera sp.]